MCRRLYAWRSCADRAIIGRRSARAHSTPSDTHARRVACALLHCALSSSACASTAVHACVPSSSLDCSLVTRACTRLRCSSRCRARLAYAQNGSTPLIWEARSPTNTVYLFGTIHVGARKMYPLSPAVEQAYRGVARARARGGPDRPVGAMLAAMASAAYKPPDNLANHISPELMAGVKKVLPAGRPADRVRAGDATGAAGDDHRHDGDRPAGLRPEPRARCALRAAARSRTASASSSWNRSPGSSRCCSGFSPELQEGMLRAAVDSVADGTLEHRTARSGGGLAHRRRRRV